MVSPRHPQWRDGNNGSKYPFEDSASLVNKAGRAIDPDTFIDAAIYPSGGSFGMYISSVEVRADEITIYIGDTKLKDLCSCSFSPNVPANELRIVDRFGRAAGVLIAKPLNLSIFSAWGAGTHVFLPTQTRFAVACCYPVPENMVTGFRLDDGGVIAGDAYLVGEDGIVLHCGTGTEIDGTPVSVIQAHAVGDPLFLRGKCEDRDMFDTPRFIKQIMFQKNDLNVLVEAGEDGNVIIATAPVVSTATVLRIRTSAQGILFEAVGERLDDL